MNAVKEGKAWMAIVIPENFTQDMVKRLFYKLAHQSIPDDVINGSTIEIFDDMTGT